MSNEKEKEKARIGPFDTQWWNTSRLVQNKFELLQTKYIARSVTDYFDVRILFKYSSILYLSLF